MTDIQDMMRKQLIKAMVQRNIFCPITRDVLDVRTCKYFVDKDGDPAYVLSPEAYDLAVSKPNIVNAWEAKGLFPMRESE